ncbi:MAG: QueT transporter family protein [Synergistaceae bacterium]|jgi:uncharacterized membrane protein|nr:QueT transporter family protein [Synergistaceae bacterium]
MWRVIAKGGVIAALYAALTVVLAPISYGPVQFRISEALTLLPFYVPEAVPGLFVGCAIANFFGVGGVWDVVFGSLATLVSALLTRRMPTLPLAAVPPVLINALVVGAVLHAVLSVPFWGTCLYVGLGEAVVCFGLGIPLMRALKRRGIV